MILGVILAGGRGLRLGGVIKANIDIAHRSLLNRVSASLAVQCDTLVLSIGTLDAEHFSPETALPTIADAPGIDAGPVGGLAAAVSWAQAQAQIPDFILTAAVDTPFFPQDFVDRALPLMQSGVDCVMGAALGDEGEQLFPTNCLWRYAAVADLPETIQTAEAPHGLRNVVSAHARANVSYPALSVNGCFFNVNTPEDLEICMGLAKNAAV